MNQQIRRSRVRGLALLLGFSALAGAQTMVDLGRQGRNVDFSSAASTKPSKTGVNLPPVCSTGETFFKTDALAGQNLYGCTSANVWTLQGDGGGSGGGASQAADLLDCKATVSGAVATVKAPCKFAVGGAVFSITADATATLSGASTSGTVYFYWNSSGQLIADENTTASLTCNASCATATTGGFPFDAFQVATATFTSTSYDVGGVTDKRAFLNTKNIECGSGLTCTESGGITTVSNDGSLSTKANLQAGGNLVCAQGNGTDSYTCAMTPSLTGYTDHMVVQLEPDVSNMGAASLSIDGLGARPIKKADGSTDPDNDELVAGRQAPLTYDGAVFRLPPSIPEVPSSATVTDYLWFRTQTSDGSTNVFGGNFACAGTNGCAPGGPHGSGDPTRFWSASYPDGASETSGVLFTVLPGNWDGAAVQVKLHWMNSVAESGNVVWKLYTACIAPGEPLTSPTYNTAQSQATAVGATPTALLQTTFSSVTMTGCSAGEEIYFRVARDAANAGDDYAAAAYLTAVQVIWTRNVVLQ